MKRITKNKGLVGKFFHSFATDDVKKHDLVWQGQVLAKIDRRQYLVQLFEWVLGETSDQVLVELSAMKNWKFYDTAEEWRNAYTIYDRTRKNRPAEEVRHVRHCQQIAQAGEQHG